VATVAISTPKSRRTQHHSKVWGRVRQSTHGSTPMLIIVVNTDVNKDSYIT